MALVIAVVWVWSLVRELLHAEGAAKKKKKIIIIMPDLYSQPAGPPEKRASFFPASP